MEHDRYQVFFDGGRQHRYFRTRVELLRFMLGMGLKAKDPTFAVWEEAGPVTLADGRQSGRRFAPVDQYNLWDRDVYDRLMSELESLTAGEVIQHG